MKKKRLFRKFQNFKTRKFLILGGLLFIATSQIVNAQVNLYNFSQQTGTYTPVSGGTLLATATGNTGSTNLDEGVFPIPLPFDFIFNHQTYSTGTAINMSANGFVTLGTTTPSNLLAAPISGSIAYDGAISAFGGNISSFFNVGGKSGEMRYEVIGTAPNRELIMQWQNFRPTSATSITNVYSFSFQIRLSESTHAIKIVYDAGAYLSGGGTAISGTRQVGLRGASNSDFNNRLSAAADLFDASVKGTANGNAQAFNTLNTPPGMPGSGLTYIWTPPTCIAPSSVSISMVTHQSAQVEWIPSGIIPAGEGFDMYYATSNVPPDHTTVLTPSNSVTVPAGTLSAPLSGLTPDTTYFVWVRAKCSTTDSSWWTPFPAIFNTQCLQNLSITGATGQTVCVGGTAVLNASANAGAIIRWYAAPSGGALLATGTSFTTPAVNSTQSYYVAASTGDDYTTAKPSPVANPSQGSGTTLFGLLFDVFSKLTIKSVTVYPVSASGASGTVTIDVLDNLGTVVQTKTFSVTGAPISALVPVVLDLDFLLQPGTTYKMRPRSYTGISGLAFDPTAEAPPGGVYAYPYAVAGILSINTSTLTASNTPRNDLYYYFYDWKVSTVCESARTEVIATVDTSCTMNVAETEPQKQTIIHPNPFTDVLNISDVKNLKSVTVMDASGRMVKTIANPSAQINLGELRSGLYLLNLSYADGNTKTVKVIKR